VVNHRRCVRGEVGHRDLTAVSGRAPRCVRGGRSEEVSGEDLPERFEALAIASRRFWLAGEGRRSHCPAWESRVEESRYAARLSVTMGRYRRPAWC